MLPCPFSFHVTQSFWNFFSQHFKHICAVVAAAKSLPSCPTLCDSIDSRSPGLPVPGVLHTRILEWVAISFSNAWKVKSESEVAQSCLTLRDPLDCSLLGYSIHGIFQARGAIAFSHMWVCSLVPRLAYLFFCFSFFSPSYRNTTYCYNFNMLFNLWILISNFGAQTW